MCAAAQREGRAARVLVVDDHPAMRSLIREACSLSPDLEVVGSAADGVSALADIHALDPDVVVLDLMLPGLTGLELVRTLREEGSRTRCLVLTARDDPEALFEAVRADVAGFLDKSTDIADLVGAIERVAAGETIITDSQQRQAAKQLGAFVRRARDSSRAVALLSDREREVLGLMREGLTTRQLATRMGLSARTVESHISSTYRKLGVHNRVQAVTRASELGLLERQDT